MAKTRTQKKVGGKRQAQQNLEKRNEFWPEVTDEDLWDPEATGAYTQISRVMPYIFELMDHMAPKLSRAYFALWCRVFSPKEGFCQISDPKTVAYEAGLTSQTGVYQFNKKLAELEKLGFIKTKSGPGGDYSFILVLNPIPVINALKKKGEITNDRLWNGFVARKMEAGMKG
jgi:hypothetical protein